MTLTEDQQLDLRTLKDFNPGTLDDPYIFPPEAFQPFHLSPEIYNREADEYMPSRCKARYVVVKGAYSEDKN
jgi:hypothetical protein